MNHGNSSAKTLEQTTTVLNMVERAVSTCVAQGKKIGSADLAAAIHRKTSLPLGFCQSVTANWLANHPTLTSMRGPGGGIVTREEVEQRKETAKNKVKGARPPVDVPGLGDDDDSTDA